MNAEMSRLQKIRCALRFRTRARETYRRVMRRLGFLGPDWEFGPFANEGVQGGYTGLQQWVGRPAVIGRLKKLRTP